MSHLRSRAWYGLAVLGLCAVLVACGDEEPAEEIGEAIEDTGEAAGEAVEDAGEAVQD